MRFGRVAMHSSYALTCHRRARKSGRLYQPLALTYLRYHSVALRHSKLLDERNPFCKGGAKLISTCFTRLRQSSGTAPETSYYFSCTPFYLITLRKTCFAVLLRSNLPPKSWQERAVVPTARLDVPSLPLRGTQTLCTPR